MDAVSTLVHRVLEWVGAVPLVPVYYAQDNMTGRVRTPVGPLAEFLLVTAGAFEFRVGDKRRQLAAGDLAVFNAHFGNEGDLCDSTDRYACVSLSVEGTRQFSDLARGPWLESVHVGNLEQVLAKYRTVALVHCAPAGPVRAFQLKATVLDLMSSLYEEAQRSASGQGDGSAVSRATTFIMEHHEEPGLTLTRIARAAHVSSAHLCRVMKSQAGLSPMRYLEEVRIKRATDLLRHTVHDVKRVSYMVGYADQLYFSRVFRRRTGTSPTGYRLHQSRTHPT